MDYDAVASFLSSNSFLGWFWCTFLSLQHLKLVFSHSFLFIVNAIRSNRTIYSVFLSLIDAIVRKFDRWKINTYNKFFLALCLFHASSLLNGVMCLNCVFFIFVQPLTWNYSIRTIHHTHTFVWRVVDPFCRVFVVVLFVVWIESNSIKSINGLYSRFISRKYEICRQNRFELHNWRPKRWLKMVYFTRKRVKMSCSWVNKHSNREMVE